MSSPIPDDNISFSILRTKYNESGQGPIPDPGPIKLSDFIGAEFAAGDPVPATNISINDFKGKTFGSPEWTWTADSGPAPTWGATPRFFDVSATSTQDKIITVIHNGHTWIKEFGQWVENSPEGTVEPWSCCNMADASANQLTVGLNNAGGWYTISGGIIWGEASGWPINESPGFKKLTSDISGTKLAVAGWKTTFNPGGSVWISVNSGQTWSNEADAGAGSGSSVYFSAVASSEDATKLAAVQWDGWIWTAVHNGASYDWEKRFVDVQESTNKWTGITSSADGTKLAACAGLLPGIERIFTSDDSGVTWTKQFGSPLSGWSCIDSSDDGTVIVAGIWINGGNQYPGTLQISQDSGVTWAGATGFNGTTTGGCPIKKLDLYCCFRRWNKSSGSCRRGRLLRHRWQYVAWRSFLISILKISLLYNVCSVFSTP